MARGEENQRKSNSDWRETLSKQKNVDKLKLGSHLKEILAKRSLTSNDWRFTLEDISDIWIIKT